MRMCLLLSVKISLTSIIGCIVFGVIFGMASHYLSVYLHKIVVTIGMFCVVRATTKKRVYDFMIIYMLCLLLVAVVQIPVIFVMDNVRLEEKYWYLLAQT